MSRLVLVWGIVWTKWGRSLRSSLRLFILVDDIFGQSSLRIFDVSGGGLWRRPVWRRGSVYDDVCYRPSCGAVAVVRLLGGEPISCDLKRLLFKKPWEDVSGTILRTVCGHLSVSPCPSLTGREKWIWARVRKTLNSRQGVEVVGTCHSSVH